MEEDVFLASSFTELTLFSKRINQKRLEHMHYIQLLSTLITNGTAYVTGATKSLKNITDLVPELFNSEITEKGNEVELHKAKMEAYMLRHNFLKGGE